MTIKCLIGRHFWIGCKCFNCGKTRDESHDWEKNCQKCDRCGKARNKPHEWSGCRCSKCRETREEEHDWSSDCEKCARCSKWRFNSHKWDGCRCSSCGKTRDESHDRSADCERCARCGKTWPFSFHTWNGRKCSKCNRLYQPALCCSGCGKKYLIGDDAGIVSVDSAYALTGKSVVATGNAIWQHEDLVFSLADVASSDLEKTRDNARGSCQAILDVKNEYQSRVWRCRACNSLNAYRVNGQTFFYENRLSRFLSHEQMERADLAIRQFSAANRDSVTFMRLADSILHDIVITRIEALKQKNEGSVGFCDYLKVDGKEDIGFLSVRREFRADIKASWADRVLAERQKNLTSVYDAVQIEQMLDNSLFAIAGRVPDYFVIEDWNSAGSFQIAPVVPETNYGKIDWPLILGDETGLCARARMMVAHITELSKQGKVEVFLKEHPMRAIEDYLYVAAWFR